MSNTWKPVFFVFIFALGFFVFSRVQFSTDAAEFSLEVVAEKEGTSGSAPQAVHSTIKKRSIPDETHQEGNRGGQSPFREKQFKFRKGISHDENSDVSETDLELELLGFERSKKGGERETIASKVSQYPRLTNSLGPYVIPNNFRKHPPGSNHKYHNNNRNRHYSRMSVSQSQRVLPQVQYPVESPFNNPHDKQYSSRSRHQSDSDRKLVPGVSVAVQSTRNLIPVISSYPFQPISTVRNPRNFPDVKSSLNITPNLIPTREDPFHFHIPIVSKTPIMPQQNLKDLIKIARKYKNPLILDSPLSITHPKTISAEHHLTTRQIESIRRIIRDSPAVDILDIEKVLLRLARDNDEEYRMHIFGEKNVDNKDQLKRSFIELAPTEEVLQELVGDRDDLEMFQERLKTQMQDNHLLQSNSNMKAATEFEISNALQRKKRQDKHHDHGSGGKLEYPLQRQRRSILTWFKKLFSSKEDSKPTTTTTTSTQRPRKKHRKSSKKKKIVLSSSSSSESDSQEGEDNIKKQKTRKKHGKKDHHRDTELDLLLPKDLRTSSYYKRKTQLETLLPNLTDMSEEKKERKLENSSELKSNESDKVDTIEVEQKKSKKNKKHSRSKRSIFEGLPYFPWESQSDSLPDLPGVEPLFNSFNENILPIQNELSSEPKKPINFMSQEEIELVHEMFSNIISEKCYPVNSQLLETLQLTLLNLLAQSHWSDISIPGSNPQVDLLLQQTASCSSDAENMMNWRSQRAIQMTTHLNYIEQGGPLLRTKRGPTQTQDKKFDLEKNDNLTHPLPTLVTPASLSQLQELASLISQLVRDACGNIDSTLLNSFTHILQQTLDETYFLRKNNYLALNNGEANELIQWYKKCSSFEDRTTAPQPPKSLRLQQESNKIIFNIPHPKPDNPPITKKTNILPTPAPVPAPPLFKSKDYFHSNYKTMNWQFPKSVLYPSSKYAPSYGYKERSQLSINSSPSEESYEYFKRKKHSRSSMMSFDIPLLRRYMKYYY